MKLHEAIFENEYELVDSIDIVYEMGIVLYEK